MDLSSQFQLTVMNTNSWLHILNISVPQLYWLIFYLTFIHNMTFSMLIRYKVFAGTLLFKAHLSIKEIDKSITYRECWTYMKNLSFLFSRILQQTLAGNKLNKFLSLLLIRHFSKHFSTTGKQ